MTPLNSSLNNALNLFKYTLEQNPVKMATGQSGLDLFQVHALVSSALDALNELLRRFPTMCLCIIACAHDSNKVKL